MNANGKKLRDEARAQRIMLATSAAITLGLGFLLAATDIVDSSSREYVSGTLLKVGFVLGMVWLAAPQIERFGWAKLRGGVLLAVVLILILIAIRPRIGAIIGAVFVAGSLVFSLNGWIRKFAQSPISSRDTPRKPSSKN